MQKNKKRESGQTLFEAILALAVFVITVATIAHLFLGSHYSAAHSVEKAQAVLLAKEGIEAVRSMRDDDFGNIEEKTADGIELVLAKWQFKGEPDTTEKFTRTINIIVSPRDLEAWQIESVITWTSVTGKEAEVSFIEDLTAWRLSPWISLDWDYRKPTTIDNTLNASALTDYQVLVTLDTASLITAGKMRSDCGDIRFADSDGSTLINYWLESGCDSASTKIWVKVPSIPASSTATIYLYYGNSTETSTGDGNTTFDFFDDFSSASLDTSKWNTRGTVTYTSGEATVGVGAASSDNMLYSKMTFDPVTRPVIFEADVKHVNDSAYGGLGFGFWHDPGSTPTLAGVDTITGWATGDVLARYPSLPDNTAVLDLQTGSYARFKVAWTDATHVTFTNGLGSSVTVTQTMIVPHYICFNTYSSAAQTKTTLAFVRKYTDPEPTTEVGVEESF